ncbi:zinc finger protein 629-like [Topomyia yanbarensis]|uniref:zinc finger protein 629-like n=1 Tax=Topomyia yanbarensis TaxID=2498891 RepID=UPI00273C1BAA|nr:zinc finger protein 629-like [Topomyia yanbarensis]
MALQIASSIKPPNDKPEAYCRVCFSSTNIKPLLVAIEPFSQHISQLLWKHLSIQLKAEDFPCALCLICQEKLEELQICNEDGLLDEWKDDDLMEFKRIGRAVNKAIRSQRRATRKRAVSKQNKKLANPPSANRVVLPFHQLDDGRYRCNLCPIHVFDHISACIKHYHESHPDSTLSEVSSGNNNSAIKGNEPKKQPYVCAICSVSFDRIDDLIVHREMHKANKRREEQFDQTLVSNASSSSAADMGNTSTNGTTNQVFRCLICSIGFYDIDALIQHRNTTHDTVNRKIPKRTEEIVASAAPESDVITFIDDYKCPHCDQQFAQSKAYYFHMNVVHDLNMCDTCGESFPSASTLVKHHTTHRSLDYPCDVCPTYRFYTKQALEQHKARKHPVNLFENVELNAVVDAGTGESKNDGLYSELLMTCSGCFLAFRTDEELNSHYADCPARGFLQGTSDFMVNDEDKIVEISDDEQ